VLEFIVLGKIPGTSTYLSFANVALGLVLIAAAYYIYRFMLEHIRKTGMRSIEETSL
jgi:hypothetical protein